VPASAGHPADVRPAVARHAGRMDAILAVHGLEKTYGADAAAVAARRVARLPVVQTLSDE